MPEHPSIFASINRWVFPLIGLFAVGPLAAWPIAALRAPDGAWDTTPILSGSPAVGLLAGAAALILAGLWGLVTSIVTSVRYGLFTTGLALAWVTWSTGTTDLIMRTEDAAAHYWRLPIEAVLFGAIAILLAGIIAAVGKKPTSDHAPRHTATSLPVADLRLAEMALRGISTTIALFRRGDARESDLPQRGLILLAAALVGAIVAWLFAVESLKGQTFGAAVIGALLGATAGEMVASSGRGTHDGGTARAPIPLFFIAATVLAVVGPVAALAVHGSSGIAEAATTAGLIAVSRPLPLDWLAGAFVGVPIGLTWADALVDRAQKT